jgi:hypothetical protein
MLRMSIALSLSLVAWNTGTCRADTLPLFSDVPGSYTPGMPFSFEITLPDGLNGLSTYNIGIVFDASVFNPKLSASANPPTSGYVFPTATGFAPNPSQSSPGPGFNEISLSFSDSSPTSVSTSSSNNILAVVTVNPGISLTGDLTISFTDDTSVTYFSEGFDSPEDSVTISQKPTPAPSVPAPPGWLSLAIGGLMAVGLYWLRLIREIRPA